jgi:hypothetical protein
MKLRSGFVSNSSTSSFLIYGMEMTPKFSKLLEAKQEGDKEDFDLYEALEESGLEYFAETEWNDIVGVSLITIGEDETLRAFKARVKTQIESVFGTQIKDKDLEMMSGEYPC